MPEVQSAGRADASDTAVGLARTFRAAGVEAGPGRVHQFVRSLAVLDATNRAHLYWAGRISLCASEDDVARYDRVFAAYFDGEAPHRRLRAVAPPRPSPMLSDDESGHGPNIEDDGSWAVSIVEASSRERLRHRDFAR